MSTRTFLYSLWCLGVVALFVLSGIFAWSPFAEGGRSHGYARISGPTHK